MFEKMVIKFFFFFVLQLLKGEKRGRWLDTSYSDPWIVYLQHRWHVNGLFLLLSPSPSLTSLSFVLTILENVGETYMQILSNGVYQSTLHKVINNSPKYRVCVAFFYEVLKTCNTLCLLLFWIWIHVYL